MPAGLGLCGAGQAVVDRVVRPVGASSKLDPIYHSSPRAPRLREATDNGSGRWGSSERGRGSGSASGRGSGIVRIWAEAYHADSLDVYELTPTSSL
jgi:hypothetical protein